MGPISHSKKIAYIQGRLPETMHRDRRPLSRSLERIRRQVKTHDFKGKGMQRLASLEHKLHKAIRKRQKRLENRPSVTFPSHLPITRKAQEIIRAIRDNRVVIVAITASGEDIATRVPVGGIGLLRQRLDDLPDQRLRQIDESLAELMRLMEVP